MIKHSKLLKVTSLQYLYNISKKKLAIEVILGMQINAEVSTSWYYPFRWKWPDMFKIPKIGSWEYFCNILRKMVATALCSIVMQNIQIFYRSPVMFVVTCFSSVSTKITLKLRSMISQGIQLFWNGLEYRNADRREKQWDKKVEAKVEHFRTT